MSQAVANVKQFAQSIKTKPISGVVGGMPSDFRKSAVNLRKEKKAYKQKVKDARSGKYDTVTGSSPGAERGIYDTVRGEGEQDPQWVKVGTAQRIYPQDDIIDAEIVEEPKAITTGPRMITSERVLSPKAIEPGRQWSNG